MLTICVKIVTTTKKHVNCYTTDFATKQRELNKNRDTGQIQEKKDKDWSSSSLVYWVCPVGQCDTDTDNRYYRTVKNIFGVY